MIKIYLLAKKINTNLKVHSDFPFCKLSILKQYYFLYNEFQIFQIFLIPPPSSPLSFLFIQYDLHPFCKLSILKQYYFLYNKFQIFQIFLILPSSILFSHLLSLFYSSNTISILNPRSKRSPIDWRSSIGQKLYSTWAKR